MLSRKDRSKMGATVMAGVMAVGCAMIDIPSVSAATSEPVSKSFLSGILSGMRTGGAIAARPYDPEKEKLKKKEHERKKKKKKEKEKEQQPEKASEVEQTEIRVDGKAICNMLREKRLELARQNNIEFRSDVCPNIEPCAGTCPKCEAEVEYLNAQLKNFPKDKIIYPELDVSCFR